MTLFLIFILLLIKFLVCSSFILDIVMIGDDYSNMFVKRLIQYSSGLGGCIMKSWCLDIIYTYDASSCAR